MCVAPLLVCLRRFAYSVLFIAVSANAQSINIGNFYYRDYLDFGQNKGAFSDNGSTTIMGKDGTEFTIPQTPNFSASSNNGNLAAVGRGFAVTANHVVNFTPSYDTLGTYRTFDLSTYQIADTSGGTGISRPYGRDEKFTRFDKYVVEGQVDMLDFENSLNNADTAKESTNINKFKDELKNFTDSGGNVYLYQAGSGIITLRGNTNTNINRIENGETKGGGFGTLVQSSVTYESLVLPSEFCNSETQNCSVRGIMFKYASNLDFNNRITSGDSGSGIYAYNTTKKEWVLLGVVSQSTGTETNVGNVANIAAVSNKDLQDYQSKFEQKINLKMTEPNTIEWTLNNTTLKFEKRGDTPDKTYNLEANKDLIFSGGGTIKVQGSIYRNTSGYAGGFVFEASSGASSTNPTKYTFTNTGNYFFKGSGLDIGENVKVEWALKGVSGDSLHKIGKGELVIKTENTTTTGLGTLKIGEGKVTLDTNTKAFENIYITSGRGELALKQAEALGATKNTNSASGTTSANSYKLAQESTDKMGFYFGKGGGKFDLAGNSLVLNTIAANDSKAIITNSSGTAVNLEIEGYGYTNNAKTDKKADTIIHASIGDNASTNGTNLNLIYKSNTKNDNAHLIFDGHINIQGALKAENANIVLQGHPTTHATISDTTIANKVQSAESGTSQKMPDYMDLSKPSTLNQPDWDSRNFNIKQGISLTNATLTVGKAANLNANITADKTSQINFGGKHFIDERDGKNIGGSGFSYYQLVKSGDLTNKTYKDSSYSGTITANGTAITSKFANFAPNLELKSGAKLNATNLTLNTNSKLNLSENSTAEVGNLIFKNFTNNDFASKFTLDSTSKFSVTQALSFDKSTFDLNTLKTESNITLPTEYNLYAFNGSTITTTNEFKNTKENAEFVLDNSTFKATSVSFQSAKIGIQNEAEFKADSLKFGAKSTIDLTNSAKFTLTKDLQTQDLNLNLLNSSAFTGDIVSTEKMDLNLDKASTLNAKSLTSNGASTINLNDKATLAITDILTSKDLTLTLKNESKFTANTLTASGIVNLQGDKNATLTLDTLNLNGANTANLNGVTSTIGTLNLTQKSQANIGENVSITTLTLKESTANLQNLNTNSLKSIDLQSNSNLYFNELNLNDFSTNSLNLKSDETSQAHIKKLIYEAQANGTKTAPSSNLVVNEKFELKNVGQNLGQNTQGTEQDKLNKDLLTLEFSKNLELKDSASLDISFADKVTKNNQDLIFDKDYKIFSASSLKGSNLNINFTKSNGASFNETNFFATGKLDKENNAFFVQFVRENPRNFSKLNPHINPTYSPLLEILLQHNKNDASIDKAVNMSDYTALNQRLAQIDTSLKTIAQGNKTRQTRNLLFSNDQTINTRISQVRLAQSGRNKHLRFAQNDTMYRIQSLMQGAVRSDAMPSYARERELDLSNSVWLNVGGGYFGGDSKMGFGATNIGYDRLIYAGSSDILLGAMFGFGGSNAYTGDMTDSAMFYNIGLYLHSIFDSQGGKYGGHEIQSNISFSINDNRKTIESKSAKNTAFGTLFALYYKYNFILAQNDTISHALKPVVVLALGYNRNGAFEIDEYKQATYNSVNFSYGFGVEYNAVMSESFYSLALTLKDMAYSGGERVFMSLSGAQNFIGYSLESAPRFSAEINLIGSHKLTDALYLQYGIAGMVDSGTNYGAKGDIKIGYKF
ncbi:anti-codon nuclease masking agent [Helicobacter fennelliae]|uniref:Anti-codon nuclease masking agent n=1 Tax=Helicobacter fennelliae TaxID=215 RepID=A0A2X3BGH4_9HELI|nr:anti-codon nuclease masking agent [Helicobacter fennelliae]